MGLRPKARPGWGGFLRSAGFVIPILLLLACGSGQKSSETPSNTKNSKSEKKQVVVFSPHGQEILDDYEKAFEKAYPDIDVVGRFVPTGQILSQLRIDKDHPTVDVWWGGTSAFFGQAKGEGLLQSYKPTWAAESKAEFHDVDDAWYAQFLQVPAIMFNNRIYKPDQVPKTWAELLDPKWKDKIVIREPMDSGTMKTIFCGIIWQM
ncbi:extracellular solute-binding protein, partial [Candidatus Sumerlaeota bacterium]|nr:extracellular solute-binding protein [Candidatus Sumerlaeota bacterium]